jgi:farnesyl diphosphate synthase
MGTPDPSAALAPLLERWRARVQARLERWLPPANIQPARLHEAMRYATLGDGKRLRPVLVYASGEALGVDPEVLDGPACAVELIHAYSLVHDDLPAMDDDDLRRGRPTCHRAFDDGTAVLAGDALQSLAFQVLASAELGPVPAGTRVEMIRSLSTAAGSRGMAGGQAIDLDSVGRELNIAELENMHIHKTGALIRSSVRLGALCQPAIDGDTLERLDHYGKCIGLAFQVQDDVLDVEGTTEDLGKTRGADAARGKPTYPALLGLAEAKRIGSGLVDEALDSLAGLDGRAEPLRWLARYIVERRS